MTNILASSAFGYWYRNLHRPVYLLSNISRYRIISVTTATQIYTKNLNNYPCHNSNSNIHQKPKQLPPSQQQLKYTPKT